MDILLKYNIKLLILVIVLSVSFPALAKNDSVTNHKNYNTISVIANNYYFPKLYSFQLRLDRNIADQFGIYYYRKIYRKLGLSIGYSKWNDIIISSHTLKPATVKGTSDAFHKGSILYRNKYKMCDLILTYEFTLSKRSRLNYGVGVSYTSGKNTVIDSIYFNPNPPYDGIIYTQLQNAEYWGIVPVIKYDYLIYNNRISIGADIRCRKYFALYSVQIDYGVHLAFNF
jgi:hypothetical protein